MGRKLAQMCDPNPSTQRSPGRVGRNTRNSCDDSTSRYFRRQQLDLYAIPQSFNNECGQSANRKFGYKLEPIMCHQDFFSMAIVTNRQYVYASSVPTSARKPSLILTKNVIIYKSLSHLCSREYRLMLDRQQQQLRKVRQSVRSRGCSQPISLSRRISASFFHI